jgi:hypothetical protein
MTLVLFMISRMMYKQNGRLQNRLPKDNGKYMKLGKIASFPFRGQCLLLEYD